MELKKRITIRFCDPSERETYGMDIETIIEDHETPLQACARLYRNTTKRKKHSIVSNNRITPNIHHIQFGYYVSSSHAYSCSPMIILMY